jgi:hypothetical protein
VPHAGLLAMAPIPESETSPGRRIELLASINNPANWTGDNAAQPAFPTLFQVTSVAEIIFQDGFESGDTNAWSAAIP